MSSTAEIPPEIASQYWGLSMYDVERECRPPITDDSTTTLQVRTLNIELQCPICLGVLHNTMTVMECLHRFCSGCISKSLRLGKKECPTCRVHCSSRRHLRPDPNFDGLIAQIYPNLDEFEAKEDRLIEQINEKFRKSGSLIEHIEQGKKRQALAKSGRNFSPKPPQPERRVKQPPADALYTPQAKTKKHKDPKEKEKNKNSPKRRKVEASDTVEVSTPQKQDEPKDRVKSEGTEISFVLLRHPQETGLAQLANKYLRTSRLLTIRHLCKFLAKKFDMADFKVFRIGLYPNSQPLTEDLTLETIDKQLWNSDEELKLYYRLTPAE